MFSPVGHWDLLSRLQEGSRKKFFLLLLICLLSCCKWDVIITSVPLGCLNRRAPSTQQPLNRILNPLWVALLLNFTCRNSHSLYTALLILSFIHQLHFGDLFHSKFFWCDSYSHWLIVPTMRLKYSIPSLLFSKEYLLQLLQTVIQSGCDSWSTSFITSKLEFKLDTREKIKPLGL